MPNQQPLTDEQLTQLAKRGELEAFTQLYQRYLPIVVRRVRGLVPISDVEDVTQEIFIATLKSIKHFRGDSSFKTWLRTLINRKVADYYRRQHRKATPPTVQMDDLDQDRKIELMIQDDPISRDERIAIQRGLASLQEKYREILLLRFAEGMQFNEIAKLNGQSLEATKSLFRRAVKALREKIS